MESAVFGIFASFAVISAIATIAWRNPIRSALSLIVCLFSLAGLYVLLNAHFLAAMQILVYAGAIMVLFVFVIMLLDVDPAALAEPRLKALAVIGGACVLLIAGKFIKVLLADPASWESLPNPAAEGGTFGTISAVGDLMFRQFIMPFELTSLLLLVAVVGAVIVARKRSGREVTGESKREVTGESKQ